MVDTTFLVDLARADPGARAAADALEEASEAVRVPAPAALKLWEGVERARRPIRESAALRDLLLALPAAPFDTRHALAAARLLADADARQAPLDPFDAMVAAMAQVEGETLLTRNTRDFDRIPDLRLRAY